MHFSAPARGSACLEAARSRLRARFVARWPGAGPTELASYRPAEEFASRANVDSSGVQSPLEAARQRLLARYLAKWPAGEDCASPGRPCALEAKSTATSTGVAEHLEAARQRLHARYVARWPAGAASAGFSSPPIGHKAEAVTGQHANEMTQFNRITTWANSLDVPTIIATAPTGHIKHVNLAWEQLCGYALKEVVGKKAAIMQGEGTDQHAAKALMQGVRGNGQAGQATLLNFKKNGQGFWNSLSVVPIYEDWVPPATGKVTEMSAMAVAPTNVGNHPLFYVGFVTELNLSSAP